MAQIRPPMTLLKTLRAWGTEEAELPSEVAAAIAESGLVGVELASAPSTWRLTTDSRIGIVVGHDGWEVRVVPRLAIPKLMFLLSYASNPRGWKRDVVSVGEENDLFAAVAAGFAHHALFALEPGPLRGYATQDETSRILRGRLRVADQVARRPGLPAPVEITFDDYTVDVLENQLLAAAASILLRMPRLPDRVRAQLMRVRYVLEDVGPPRTADAPQATRLNRRYTAATWLASLVLRGSSITTAAGAGRSVSFVFDMNQVFEDFLTVALTDALREHGGIVRSQFDGYHLDHERRLRLRPDITWWVGGRPAAVIDAKYKRLEDVRFPNADAYQMLAYCLRFGLSSGMLVYAKDNLEADRLHSLPADVGIRVRAVDVEREPSEVLEQIHHVAREVATLRRSRTEGASVA
jgi:5-methylcytosine-specific restriction enzyme subunit McrC